MKHTLTPLLSLALVLAGVTNVHGQEAGPPLGDNFIFFVDGVNTMVPEAGGNVIDDPTDPTNKIMEYVYGNWTFDAFRFPADVGVDMSQNRMDGDVLHARIWVDPANAGMANVQLLLEDKTDGSGANDGSADLPFRLAWRIPEDMRDGQWHEISIPLPPPTYAELEDAKAANELDGLDSLWKYAGAWSTGGFGVGVSDELGPNTADNTELWKEFEWTNVQNLGVHFDNNTGGGTIYLDDVYIGAADLDLSDQTAPPPAAVGVSAVATADSNTVSWMSIDGANAYKVYFSLEEITDVEGAGVSLAAQVGADATSASHKIEVPHASLLPITLYYAVTTLSDSGVENTDISMSTASVVNENLPVQPYIAELSTEEVDHLDDLLFGDSFENIANGFPEGYMPFELNMAHSKPGDAGSATTDEDISASLWAGYRADPPELYLYVEVTDDQVTLQGTEASIADSWQNDSIEFGWGNYDVRDVAGGGVFIGSPHQDMERGEFADYQFRFLAQGDGTKGGSTPHVYVGWSIDGAPQGAGAIYDQLMDGDQVVGYKMLGLIPLDQIQNTEMMDAVVALPTDSDIHYYPFNFVLNDGDGANRDNQIQWSIKANADGQWWNTPAQWPAVALVGRDAQSMMTAAGISFSAMADGSAITTLALNEGTSQTYYVKLASQPTADVTVAITGQAGTSLTLDNDGNAETEFTGLTFTSANWATAQPVMVMSAVDLDGDNESVTLVHTATSDDTAYGGMSFNLAVTVTDVTQTSVEDADGIPDEIALDQNYPNPFNPSTLIQFALPESEVVTLRVFDSMGRTVATLLNQQPYTAGRYTIEFNGSELASGIYLYRLETGSSVLMTRRMTLVK